MSGADRFVMCDTHGSQPATFVCLHLVQSLASDQPVGFNASVESDTERPDAWCDSCEERRIAEGGDWTDASNDYLQIKLLCGMCYDRCRDLNTASRLH